MIKNNKKGFMRIIEAVIAILLILTAVLIFISQQTERFENPEEIYATQRSLLEIIANNETLRNEVIRSEHIIIDEFIARSLPTSLGFTTSVCSVDEICNEGTPNDKIVYVSETIISANLTNYPDLRSQKLQFYTWRK